MTTQYPIPEDVPYEIFVSKMDPTIVDLFMYGENDTLGCLLRSVWSQDEKNFRFVGNQMGHPFLKDLEKKCLICHVTIAFHKEASLETYKKLLGESLQRWSQKIMEPTMKAAYSVFRT